MVDLEKDRRTVGRNWRERKGLTSVWGSCLVAGGSVNGRRSLDDKQERCMDRDYQMRMGLANTETHSWMEGLADA